MANNKLHVKTPAKKSAAQIARTRANIERHNRLRHARSNIAKLVKRASASPGFLPFVEVMNLNLLPHGAAALYFALNPPPKETEETAVA